MLNVLNVLRRLDLSCRKSATIMPTGWRCSGFLLKITLTFGSQIQFTACTFKHYLRQIQCAGNDPNAWNDDEKYTSKHQWTAMYRLVSFASTPNRNTSYFSDREASWPATVLSIKASQTLRVNPTLVKQLSNITHLSRQPTHLKPITMSE